MRDHDFEVLRAEKQRIGAAYAKARDVPGARICTLDGPFADALRLCLGSRPATQAKILASYAAQFERMAD
jgi:hypothetical protein